jgi:hypothetical protein
MLVQSRRPPRRGEPRTEGGFLQLRVSTLGGLRVTFEITSESAAVSASVTSDVTSVACEHHGPPRSAAR